MSETLDLFNMSSYELCQSLCNYSAFSLFSDLTYSFHHGDHFGFYLVAEMVALAALINLKADYTILTPLNLKKFLYVN